MKRDRGKSSDNSEQIFEKAQQNASQSAAETPDGPVQKPARKAAAKKATKNSTKAGVKTGVKTGARLPYERPRGVGVRSISDLMPEVGRTAFRRFGFIQSSIVSRWPDIVGARHARVCSPEMLRFPLGEKSDGTLHLVVKPAHAPMIQHVVPEIITRVNRFFGYKAVAKVKIRQGEVKAPNSKKPTPVTPIPATPVPQELGQSFHTIQDPELRAALESLARSIYAKDQDNQ